jgi:hypothetical protein
VAGRLRPQRHRQLGDGEQHEHQGGPDLWQGQPGDPPELKDADTSGEAQGRAASGRVGDGDAQPLRHQRQAHDHVAQDHHPELALVEGSRDAGGHDQHAGHLHEDGQAVQGVVVVERGREPGEVHPGPPDGEEDQREADQGVLEVPLHQAVVETVGGLGDGDDEGEIEEELERRRGAVGLGWVPRSHAYVELHVRDLRGRRSSRVPIARSALAGCREWLGADR